MVVNTADQKTITVETAFVASVMRPIDDLTDRDFIRLGRRLYRRALKERDRSQEEE